MIDAMRCKIVKALTAQMIYLFLISGFFWGGVLSLSSTYGSEKPYISVGEARTKKTVLAFPEIRPEPRKDTDQVLVDSAKKVHETVMNDLSYINLFSFLSPDAFIENTSEAGLTFGGFKLSDWTSIGVEFLIKSKLLLLDGKNIALEVYLYDTLGSKQIFGKKYIATPSDVNTLAHTVANNIVESLTSSPGIFLTKIATTCDRTGKKEIYMMSFDGTEVKQITHHRSIAFAPAWSPDGMRIAYSLFTRHADHSKNIDLYEFDFKTSTYRLLSNRKGINSGATYTPDGKGIVLTMSFLGNPEIFSLNLSQNTVTRLTNSFGFDVDPNWSPDGKKLAFVSSRTGAPMAFIMHLNDLRVQRLTYAGRYNATPSWSPRGNKIAFAGWIDRRFDIFLINPDGTKIERLTKDQGSNEDPYFSPDGNFLVFSSNRSGQQNLYVMDTEGRSVRRLTYGLGNCVAPKWSNPPPHE